MKNELWYNLHVWKTWLRFSHLVYSKYITQCLTMIWINLMALLNTNNDNSCGIFCHIKCENCKSMTNNRTWKINWALRHRSKSEIVMIHPPSRSVGFMYLLTSQQSDHYNILLPQVVFLYVVAWFHSSFFPLLFTNEHRKGSPKVSSDITYPGPSFMV